MVFSEKWKIETNLLRLLISFSVATIAGLQLHAYLFWNIEDLASYGLISDDAFFYSVIARNLQEHHVLSFDGDMTTNGVQPLWMLVQAILQLLSPDANGVVLLCWSSWICYVAFVFFIIWYLNHNPSISSTISTLIVSGMLLLQPYFQRTVLKGLETPIMLLNLILTLIFFDHICIRIKQESYLKITDVCLLAFMASLLFLSRTDLFLAPVILFTWIMIFTKRQIFRNLLIFSSIVSSLVLPYLVYNYATQESLMPISGRVKLFYLDVFFPSVASYLSSNEWHGPYAIFDYTLGLGLLPVNKLFRFSLILFMIVTAWIVVWRNRFSTFFPHSIKMFGTITFLHLIYMQIFYRELRPYTSYYFAPEIIFFILVVAFGVRTTFNRQHNMQSPNKNIHFYITKFSCIFIVIAAISIFFGSWRKCDSHPHLTWIQRLNLSHDISRIVPENEKIAAFWPGLIAQFCNRQVVPLDGIIGSNEYFQRYVKTGSEINYMKERNIRFLAIYIDRSLDELLSGETPNISSWSLLGVKRLWENRKDIVQVHSARLIDSKGSGWYLIELREKTL